LKQQFFEQQHQHQWQRLQELLESEPLSKGDHLRDVAEFPRLYRQVCQHLALARARHYTPWLIERLNHLVLSGHQQLYRHRQIGLGQRVATFFARDLARSVRAEWRLFTVAALLFFGTLFGMALSIHLKPDLVYTLLDPMQVAEIEAMYAPSVENIGRERDAGSDFFMFGFYIRNNTGIGFQTYASGLLLGLGTIFYLVFNGLFIGAIAGHLTYIGYNETFFSFVSGHSAPELGAIILAGTAGLKLGYALIAPGPYARLYALRRAALATMPLVYGFAGLFLFAAFIEAFWSSSVLPPYLKYSVGGLLFALLCGYFLFAGRHDSHSKQE
jgi:uncharacterized membrane protein SpoIIM required for sporulation